MGEFVMKSRRVGSDRVMAMALAMMMKNMHMGRHTTRKQENYLIELLQLVDYYEEHSYVEPAIFRRDSNSESWNLENVRENVKKIVQEQKYDENQSNYLNSLRVLYTDLKKWKEEYDDLPF